MLTCKNGHERIPENRITDSRGHDICRLCRNEAVNRHYHRNQERLTTAMRIAYQIDSTSKLESRRAYHAAHPEVARRHGAKRRALKHNAFVEHVEPLVVLELDDGVCGICGEDVNPFDFHVDHAIPLVRGGEHSYANAQVAHPVCNLRKNASVL